MAFSEIVAPLLSNEGSWSGHKVRIDDVEKQCKLYCGGILKGWHCCLQMFQ